MSVKRLLAVSTLAVASVALSSFAGPASVFDARLRQVLRNAPDQGTFTLRNVALGRQTLDTIELQRMEVWAKDAKIIVSDGAGGEKVMGPPAIKYFKGRIVGDDESVVFFSMSDDGSIRGMAVAGERRWTIGSGVRKFGRARDALPEDYAPVLIFENDVIDEMNDPAANWECMVKSPAHPEKLRGTGLNIKQQPRPDAGNISGATYQLRIAIETDDEFCTAFGNNTTSLNAYIGDLIGKASTVYSRDLNTTLLLGTVSLRTTGSDPWTVTTSNPFGALAGLAEFGKIWHTSFPQASFPRSSAVFLSGKLFSAGFAWSFNALCDDDFACGADGSSCGGSPFENSYAGGYAFCGSSVGVATDVPDPTATINGVQYGMPPPNAANKNFWMLLEFMHELGHNMGGPHTQCVGLTAQEKIDYSTSRNFVDECWNRDGSGCFGGTTANCNLIPLDMPGADPYCDAPPEKGTIMSYCHNIFPSGFRESRYMFGKAGEPSFKMLGLFRTELEIATPDPTITLGQSEPVLCSAGKTASVNASCPGCTYAWQISGGSITSSTSTSSVTYTPTQSSVTLTVTVVSARGCGITVSKTITTLCVAVLAPTNVVATASSTTNVNISWTASIGAASYNVYRSTNGTSFTLAGNIAASPFPDSGRTANTGYIYKVRAVNGGESADSNRDLATTVIFTDDPLTIGTIVQTAHITQLRTAVDAVRTMIPLAAGTYTDPTLTGGTTTIKAAHINDLRTALDQARANANLSLSAISYGETITASTTAVKASHVTELRDGVK